MKVAFLCGSDAKQLQEEVNNFIQDKSIIDMKYSSLFINDSYSEKGVPIHGTFYDRVMIMYAEESVNEMEGR